MTAAATGSCSTASHGEWLRAVSEVVTLVWCTTWWRVANEQIAPRVGLPTDLPAVWLPRHLLDTPQGYSAKTPLVRRWAAENQVTRLAWLDDNVADHADRIALTLPASTRDSRLTGVAPLADALVVTVDPDQGLTEPHLDRVRRWAQRRTGGPAT